MRWGRYHLLEGSVTREEKRRMEDERKRMMEWVLRMGCQSVVTQKI